MATFKILSKKVQGESDHIYLYLSKLETGMKQPEITALKVKIPVKDWKSNRVSKEINKKYLTQKNKTFESVEQFNKWIDEQLSNFVKINGDFNFIPSEEKRVNDWIVSQIKSIKNQGSIMRYENIFNLMKSFQKYYTVNHYKRAESEILYFKDLTVEWIKEFRNWLININGNEHNSSNYKVKALQGLINKAHIQRHYIFVVNPFDFIDYKFEDSDKLAILDKEDLIKLRTTEYIECTRRKIPESEREIKWRTPIPQNIIDRNKAYKARVEGHHRLKDIVNYWCFQLFSQGIRVSDIITLRWNDFDFSKGELRLHKRMFKTKMFISVLVNDKMTDIISEYIIRYSELFEKEGKELNRINENIARLYSNYKDVLNTDVRILRNVVSDNIYSLAKKWIVEETNPELGISEGYIISLKVLNEIENTELFGFEETDLSDFGTLKDFFNESIVKEKTEALNAYKEAKKLKYDLVCKMIVILSKHKEYKTNFTFNLVRDKYFSDIDSKNDFGKISKDQYRKTQSAKTLYNSLLKIIAFQAGIEKNLTTHVARHSYTSLMLELGDENINLFDLMGSLGHKHLSTTQIYIQRFTHKKVDKLNLVIANNLDEE